MSELDNLRFPARKNPRLQGYDYSANNYYFVTICTHKKQCIFGPPGNLNEHGKIAAQLFLEIATHFPSVQVHKFVVMPNHIHGILELTGNDTNLSSVLGLYKAAVTKHIHRSCPDKKVW